MPTVAHEQETLLTPPQIATAASAKRKRYAKRYRKRTALKRLMLANGIETLTPPEIARGRYGCKVDKVLDWIKSGELRAINIAQDPNGERPRYRVYLSDLEDFERRRASAPLPQTPQRRKPRRADEAAYARY